MEAEEMRYRRLSHRYALMVTSGQPRPFGETIFIEKVGVRLAQPSWRPATDVYETKTAVTVTIELAGVDPEAIEITVFEDAVVVEGNRRLELGDGTGVFHAAEIRQGKFRLEV